MIPNDPSQPPSPGSPAAARQNLLRVWLVFQMQSVAFVVVLIVVALTMELGGHAPQWGGYVLAAAALAIAPSFVLLRRYREAESRRHRGDAAAEVATLQALQQKLVMGLAVADLPAILGFVHFVLTGDVTGLAAFGLATTVLVYLYRPAPG